MSTEIDSVIKILPTQKTLGLDAFTNEFYEIFKNN